MEVATLALARQHFGLAQLGDRRRTKWLVNTAAHILAHPGTAGAATTLPQKLPDWADLMGLYRLAAATEVTHPAVLAPHRQRTLEAMAAHEGGVVLLLHDATELDYTHCRELGEQLGQIGNGGGRGYIAHHTLAVTPQRQVLGLVSQVLHHRRSVSKRETRAQKRQHPQRESRLWLAGCQAMGQVKPPAGKLWIDVADRGSDTLEFIGYEHAHDRRYVIRSAKDRRLSGADHVGSDRIHQHLHDYARDLPTLGTRSIHVPAKAGKHPARQANVRVAAGPLTLAGDRWTRGELPEATTTTTTTTTTAELDLWVIHVRELDPPDRVEPLEWILLSNLPAASFAQAAQLIDFYSCRPLIEELHKGQKSGMGIERLQFESAQRLEPVIALLSVTTVLLLQLRQASRQHDADLAPARQLVPLLFVQVLSARLSGQARDDLSVRQFLYGVARLGGHLGRRHDGPPGWQTLWRGWNDLQLMVQGVEALRLSG
jgi:hypothetical protein